MTSGWNSRHSSKLRALRPGFLLGLLSVCAPVGAPQEEAPRSETLRIHVDRVDVGVLVTDAKGRFVEGLDRMDFALYDDGALQPVTEFAPVDAPAEVLLLVEAGPAVYLLEDTHLFTAEALLEGLSPADRVAIVRYSDRPRVLLDFTDDKRAAQSALEEIPFAIGFAQLNLSLSLNATLDWLAPLPGKKTILLLSTGVDSSPRQSMQDLLARLESGDVRLLTVSLAGPLRTSKHHDPRQPSPAQEALAEADAWLRALAEATGGRAYFPENAKAVEKMFRQLAQLLRHEYSMAFAPPAADGKLHTVTVQVAPKSGQPPPYRVDHRKAYRAPPPQQ